MRKFKEFLEEREAGRFLVNPFWLEHLLNLAHQGYLGEVWEEITKTKINQMENIEFIGYGTISLNFDEEGKI